MSVYLRKIDGRHICAAPACTNNRPKTATYCSEQCRIDGRKAESERREIAKCDHDAKHRAGRAEPCRDCPGAAWFTEIDGERRCWCGMGIGAAA